MSDDSNVSLAENAKPETAQPMRLDQTYAVFLIFVTGLCIYGAVKYWAMIMGITYNGTLRFDLAPNHWRIVGACLALLLPLTALGVWFRNSFGLWGWMLFAMIQILMHGFLTERFGTAPLQLIFVCFIALAFIAFRFAFIRRARLKAQ